MHMFCTPAQAQALLANRRFPKGSSQRKSGNRRIMAEIKRDHGLSQATKLVLFIEDEGNPLYAQIRSKRTKLPLDDGRPQPQVVPSAPVATPVPTVVAPAPAPEALETPTVAVKRVRPPRKVPTKVAEVAAKPSKSSGKAVASTSAKKAPVKAPVKKASPGEAVSKTLKSVAAPTKTVKPKAAAPAKAQKAKAVLATSATKAKPKAKVTKPKAAKKA